MRTYDARMEREWLAQALVDWENRRFIPSDAARRFDRRLRTLARVLGWSRVQVLEQARADAEQIRMNEEATS